MARVRSWSTTSTLTGDTTTVSPTIVDLLPGIDIEVTVVRTIATVQVSAVLDNPAEIPRPIILIAGILVGPPPTGLELVSPNIEVQDWLYLASQTTTPVTFGSNVIYYLDSAGPVAQIGTRASRRVAPAESAWLMWRAELTSGTSLTSGRTTTRALYLEPL